MNTLFSIRQTAQRLAPNVVYFFCEPLFKFRGMRRRQKASPLSDLKDVLVIRADEIGDLVLTTPFLRELRRNMPDARITLVIKPSIMPLFELCPYIDELLAFPMAKAEPLKDLRHLSRMFSYCRQQFWPRRFDLVILPRWDVDSLKATFLAYLSGAERRMGFSENVIGRKHENNRGYDRLLTDAIVDKSIIHEVLRNLELITVLGGKVESDELELWLSKEDNEYADALLNNQQCDDKNLFVAVAPGASDANRCWPITCFAELCEWLEKEHHARIIVIGGPGEELLASAISDRCSPINIVNKATLRQSTAVMARCGIFVGNDSGPLHLASAVGIRAIEISYYPNDADKLHPNSPARFGPWCPFNIVLQPTEATSSDEKTTHCTNRVSIAAVENAVTTLLGISPTITPL